MVNGKRTGWDSLLERRIARGVKRAEQRSKRRASKLTPAQLALNYRLRKAGIYPPSSCA